MPYRGYYKPVMLYRMTVSPRDVEGLDQNDLIDMVHAQQEVEHCRERLQLSEVGRRDEPDQFWDEAVTFWTEQLAGAESDLAEWIELIGRD